MDNSGKPRVFERHDIVWLNPRGWQVAIAQAAPEVVPQLWQWRERDWPLIVRTQDADIGHEGLAVGAVLAPSAAQAAPLRVALRTLREGVRASGRAPALGDVLPSLPDSVAERLHSLAHAPGPALETAGMLALQGLTGQTYIDADSPLQLVLRPQTKAELQLGLAKLAAHAATLAAEIEIMFPSGHAVAWEEWRAANSGRTHLMTKDLSTIRLMHVQAILTSLPP
ncbi:phosphoribosyl-dephospho-CoA transferase MdcG domain-containing protein [Massilia sp. TS11]|uniref:phosphoribosyl-dephospho-CoA transferase MdcG domain-containing protein n=1 Tax=Massilia sp. TS11 TaxID=2908003 RepID=UPI001EDB62F1|nr:phosphoribosyl-dephospho-CoA transferase MdcG domain-containing protein [Massilia sp. TS11]MCG2584660.1 hypothetical protein [Massilia sp. TS11]